MHNDGFMFHKKWLKDTKVSVGTHFSSSVFLRLIIGQFLALIPNMPAAFLQSTNMLGFNQFSVKRIIFNRNCFQLENDYCCRLCSVCVCFKYGNNNEKEIASSLRLNLCPCLDKAKLLRYLRSCSNKQRWNALRERHTSQRTTSQPSLDKKCAVFRSKIGIERFLAISETVRHLYQQIVHVNI